MFVRRVHAPIDCSCSEAEGEFFWRDAVTSARTFNGPKCLRVIVSMHRKDDR